LSVAAYQITQTLLSNRLPVATVLNTPRTGEVILRGGSTLGFHKGMILTTARRGQVTGRVRITLVNPAESYGDVLEDSKGIAPGDKAVPIFEFEYSSRVKKDDRDRAGLQIAAMTMLGLLGTLVVTQNGNKQMQNVPPVPTVAAMSDATTMGEVEGANLVRWPWQGARVIAYIVYRDTNPYAPVGVVDGHTTEFIDSSLPLPEIGTIMESTTVTITLDQAMGIITSFTRATAYDPDLAEQFNDDMSYDPGSFDITTRRVPLVPGQKVGYRIRILYMDYEDVGLEDPPFPPENYSLFLGNIGQPSVRVTDTKPPALFQPADNGIPTDGIWRCERVPIALSYTLQVSLDPTFATQYRFPMRGVVPHVEGDDYIAATYSLPTLYNELAEVLQRLGRPPTTEDTPIYWRMGARVAGEPQPAAWEEADSANTKGWVFSETRVFLLPPVPPPFPGWIRAIGPGSNFGPSKQPVSPREHTRMYKRR